MSEIIYLCPSNPQAQLILQKDATSIWHLHNGNDDDDDDEE